VKLAADVFCVQHEELAAAAAYADREAGLLQQSRHKKNNHEVAVQSTFVFM
jgi:hypothetical protein